MAVNQHLPYALEDCASSSYPSLLEGLSAAVEANDDAELRYGIRAITRCLDLRYKLDPSTRAGIARVLLGRILSDPYDHVRQAKRIGLLTRILKKRRNVPLEIAWRPLYDLVQDTVIARADRGFAGRGIREVYGSGLLQLVEHARRFFPASAAAEIVAELKPQFCPHDWHASFRAQALLVTFMPTHQGLHEPWFADVLHWLEYYETASEWMSVWLGLLSRLAKDSWRLRVPGGEADAEEDGDGEGEGEDPDADAEGEEPVPVPAPAAAGPPGPPPPPDWAPLVPWLFARLLRDLELPVGGGRVGSAKIDSAGVPAETRACLAHVYRSARDHRVSRVVKILVYTMKPAGPDGKPTAVLGGLERLLGTVGPYFHPSNSGGHSNSLARLVSALVDTFAARLQVERKHAASPLAAAYPHPDALGEADVAAFAELLLPHLNLSLFSKSGSLSQAAIGCMRQMAYLAPQAALAPLLADRILPALGLGPALDERVLAAAHHTIGAIEALSALAHALLWRDLRPRVPVPLLDLLNATLPGIDANDPSKTRATLRFYTNVLYCAPLVPAPRGGGGGGGFDGMEIDGAGDEAEEEARRASHGFGEWAEGFLGRLLEMLGHAEKPKKGKDAQEEWDAFLLQRAAELLFAQLASGGAGGGLYDSALDRVVALVSDRELPNARKQVSLVVGAAVAAHPERALPRFLRIAERALDPASHPADSEWTWHVGLLAQAVRRAGAALLKHLPALRRLLDAAFADAGKKKVVKAGGKLLRRVLWALTAVYTTDLRSLPPSAWKVRPLSLPSPPAPSPLSFVLSSIRSFGRVPAPNHTRGRSSVRPRSPVWYFTPAATPEEGELWKEWGRRFRMKDELQVTWHVPSPEEAAAARALAGAYLAGPLATLRDGAATAPREALYAALQTLVAVARGSTAMLDDWLPEGDAAAPASPEEEGGEGAHARPKRLLPPLPAGQLPRAAPSSYPGLPPEGPAAFLPVLSALARGALGRGGARETDVAGAVLVTKLCHVLLNVRGGGEHELSQHYLGTRRRACSYFRGIQKELVFEPRAQPRALLVEQAYQQHQRRLDYNGMCVPYGAAQRALLADLEALSAHPFAKVRKKAQGSLLAAARRYPPALNALPQQRQLAVPGGGARSGSPAVGAATPEERAVEDRVTAACCLLQSVHLVRRITRDWRLAARFARAILATSHHEKLSLQSRLANLFFIVAIGTRPLPLADEADRRVRSDLFHHLLDLLDASCAPAPAPAPAPASSDAAAPSSSSSSGAAAPLHWRYQLMALTSASLLLRPDDAEPPAPPRPRPPAPCFALMRAQVALHAVTALLRAYRPPPAGPLPAGAEEPGEPDAALFDEDPPRTPPAGTVRPSPPSSRAPCVADGRGGRDGLPGAHFRGLAPGSRAAGARMRARKAARLGARGGASEGNRAAVLAAVRGAWRTGRCWTAWWVHGPRPPLRRRRGGGGAALGRLGNGGGIADVLGDVLASAAGGRGHRAASSQEAFVALHAGLAQGIARTAGPDAALGHLWPLLEKLARTTSERDNQCTSAELFAGIVRGSRRWPLERQRELWGRARPLLRACLDAAGGAESVADWAGAIRFLVHNRDPRRFRWLAEELVSAVEGSPSTSTAAEGAGAGAEAGAGTAAAQANRLKFLQPLLDEFDWKARGLAARLVAALVPGRLRHPFKQVPPLLFPSSSPLSLSLLWSASCFPRVPLDAGASS
eukprot:tig00000498_g1675.t1